MRNLWKVILSGMAIGIAFLMFGYIGIYYVSGEVMFAEEIALLGEIETLRSQVMIAAISGLLISLSIYYIEKTMMQEKTATHKIVLGAIFLATSSIISMILIETMNENISDMLVMISATLVSIYALINGVRTLYYDIKLNKNENKEKQIQSQEKGN